MLQCLLGAGLDHCDLLSTRGVLKGLVKGSTGKFPLETSCFGALLCYRLCRPAMACPDL